MCTISPLYRHSAVQYIGVYKVLKTGVTAQVGRDDM